MNWEDYVLVLDEMERSAYEVGYSEEDDEFDFDFDP